MPRLLAALSLVAVTACSGETATTPSSVLSESGASASGSSSLHELPPVAVGDYSCPTQPPTIKVTTAEESLQIEWSRILSAAIQGWQGRVLRREGNNRDVVFHVFNEIATRQHYAFRPGSGIYTVDVRSKLPSTCGVNGGYGNWSQPMVRSIDEPRLPVPQPPVPKPPVVPPVDPCAPTLKNHPPSPNPPGPQPPVCESE